jgi:hypothetical protein
MEFQLESCPLQHALLTALYMNLPVRRSNTIPNHCRLTVCRWRTQRMPILALMVATRLDTRMKDHPAYRQGGCNDTSHKNRQHFTHWMNFEPAAQIGGSSSIKISMLRST